MDMLQENDIEDDLGVGEGASDDAETDHILMVVEQEIVQGMSGGFLFLSYLFSSSVAN